MFELARPWVLALLLPLAVLGWGMIRRPGATLVQALPAHWEAFAVPRVRVPLPRWLRLAAMALLILGLAGPRTRHSPPPGQGTTILFALDLSGSMETRDMGGRSRLAVAREEVRQFVQARPDDLLGLVTFSRQAMTRVPPTRDHRFLLQALEALRADEESDGTALGTGLGLAAHRAIQAPTPSRTVVLLTDGRNNSGSADPVSVARAAGSLQLRVHVVGVGGVRGEEPLDETVLTQVSAMTGGRYFRARDPMSFQEVMAQVDGLEKGPIPAATVPVFRPCHAGLLWAGAFLLLVEGLLWALPGRRGS